MKDDEDRKDGESLAVNTIRGIFNTDSASNRSTGGRIWRWGIIIEEMKVGAAATTKDAVGTGSNQVHDRRSGVEERVWVGGGVLTNAVWVE